MTTWLRTHSHHLRWQLVTGFTASVALLLALLIGAERVLVQRSLTDNIRRDLTASVNSSLKPLISIGLSKVTQPGMLTVPAGTGVTQSTSLVPIKSAAGFVANFTASDQPAAFLDSSGAVLASAVSLKEASPTQAQVQSSSVLTKLATEASAHTEGSASWTGTVTTPGGDYLEVAQRINYATIGGSSSAIATTSTKARSSSLAGADSGTITSSGSIQLQPATGLLLVAHSLAATEQAVRTVTLISVLGAAAVLALTIVLALVVVRTALRPLATITGGVERLAQGDYGYRLAAPAGTDEVGRLAGAFDRMAGAIGTAFATQRRFVADASHELRTPLTALRGYTDVLLLGVRDDPATADRVLHAMQDDLIRMSRLVNDLLTLARLDGEGSLRLEPLPLQPLLEAARDEAAVIAGDLHTVGLDCPDEPAIVLADRDRLRQVLSNVLGNACAYATEHTPIRICLACNGGAAVITVEDRGPGIPREALARLGERFYRGDGARSRRTGGTGLGIAIARGIMRAHGGSLVIDSDAGQGTTVTITIPEITAARTSLSMSR